MFGQDVYQFFQDHEESTQLSKTALEDDLQPNLLSIQQERQTTIKISNVVSNFKLSEDPYFELDLNFLSLKLRNTQFNPNKFPALKIELREPNATALVFKNGKVVCAGAKDLDQSLKASRIIARMIQKHNEEASFCKFEVNIVVAAAELPYKLDLVSLGLKHPENTHYNPEAFPGLRYKHQTPKITVMMFVSGKITFTEAKNLRDIEKVYGEICEISKEFRV